VRLDGNQRQSRAEKRILRRNVVCPGGNVQQKGGYGGESYGGRGGQITWQTRVPHIGTYRGGERNANRGENQ